MDAPGGDLHDEEDIEPPRKAVMQALRVVLVACGVHHFHLDRSAHSQYAILVERVENLRHLR
ncbi:hypothetical protein AB4Z54_49875, partial [Streptomyces sp. MCAF7]